ncbi:WGR domain-containing protein [Stenotrophomonas sp. 278]|uniref:WGR domain-containing protein n=1 Tax=Stenotrophomonas sp. 278 TaxID=2479851 RepID=UPI000F65BA7D|nr:WGR domain-containing protein [Stenotrophomonas sp. 278]RRU25685.1 hypothetical protein EGJ34_00035 [Stenotrophomonas sp. 278]
MHVYLQQQLGGSEPVRFVRLTLQPDLFGCWELLRESGSPGRRSQLRVSQFELAEEAQRAFEHERDALLTRQFQILSHPLLP